MDTPGRAGGARRVTTADRHSVTGGLLASIAQVLHHARHCVPDGAHLLLVDFWTDPTHTQPLLTVLMAGELLIHSSGDVYREAEACGWLTASGRRTVERTSLAGLVSLVVAETAV